MKSPLLFLALGAAVLLGAGYVLWSRDARVSGAGDSALRTSEILGVASYVCEDEKTIEAAYGNLQATLTLGDGREYTLEQTVAASGIRYANEGEQIVFWSKGDEAFLQEDGVTTYANCFETSSEVFTTPNSNDTAEPGGLIHNLD